MTGWFNHVGGIEAHGLARWDGVAWYPVHDLPSFNGGGLNYLNDMIYYQSHVYIGGNFNGGNGRKDIAYYDGTDWVACSNGIDGGTSAVYEFAEHDGLLYVAGYISNVLPWGPPSDPGSGVVTWNGSAWGALNQCTQYANNPSVFDMVWLRDTLYVSGIFTLIDGIPTNGLMRWDGEHW